VNNSPHANFVLMDGGLRPDAIKQLYQRGEPLEVIPLYIGTRWQALQDSGPLLIALQGSSGLIHDIRQSAFEQADASLLYSRASMHAIAEHLRRFIAPSDVLGGDGLLRFADPLVTRAWLGSYQREHLDAVLGPIEAWYIPEIHHSWEPAQPFEWLSVLRAAAPPEWVNAYAQLGEAQLAALDQAARWRFMERVNRRLEQNHPTLMATLDSRTRTQWFAQRLDEAETWGLSSERSLTIWTEYSLRWGPGFTLRPNTPYQQWLAGTPGALKRAPELRIQQMDNDCLAIEINEDMQ